MWILGNASTLERSPVWGALIENARQRSSIVPNAAPARLFPGCPLQMTSPDPPPFGASRPAEGESDQFAFIGCSENAGSLQSLQPCLSMQAISAPALYG